MAPPEPPQTPAQRQAASKEQLKALLQVTPDAVVGPYRLVDQTLLYVKDDEVAGAIPAAGLSIEHSRGRNVWIPVVMGVLVLFTASCGFIPWLASGEFVPGPPACCMILSPLFLIGFGITLLRWNDVTVRQWLVMTTAQGRERRWRLPPDTEQHTVDHFVAKVRQAADRPPPAPPDVPEGKAWILMDHKVQVDTEAELVDWCRTAEPTLAQARKVWARVGDAHLQDPRLRPDVLGLAFYGNRLARVAQVSYDHPDAVRDWLGGQDVMVLVPGPSALDHQLRVILSATGEPQDPDSLPPANTQAIRRRRRTVERLTDQGYPIIGAQPYQEEVRLQDAEAVARRAICLGLIVGPLAAAATQGAPLPGLDELPPSIQPFAQDLTPQERAFLQDPDPQAAQAMQWRIEGGLALLWALGLVQGELSMSEQTDGQAIVSACERLGVAVDQEPELKVPELRDLDQILDLLDDVYCRHWMSVDDRVNGRDPSARPHHPGITYERLYALCWLTGFLNDPDMTWDTVHIST